MTDKENLARAIVKNGWYKTGDFVLSSGRRSDYYVDLRPCIMKSRYMHMMTTCMIPIIAKQVCMGDLLCGVITSGLFLTGALLQRCSGIAIELNAIYCRTEHRVHGSRRDIEGDFQPSQEVIIIDDVATSGSSLYKVLEILNRNNLRVKAAIVVVDRNEGAREVLAACDVPLLSVMDVDYLRSIKDAVP